MHNEQSAHATNSGGQVHGDSDCVGAKNEIIKKSKFKLFKFNFTKSQFVQTYFYWNALACYQAYYWFLDSTAFFNINIRNYSTVII